MGGVQQGGRDGMRGRGAGQGGGGGDSKALRKFHCQDWERDDLEPFSEKTTGSEVHMEPGLSPR